MFKRPSPLFAVRPTFSNNAPHYLFLAFRPFRPLTSEYPTRPEASQLALQKVLNSIAKMSLLLRSAPRLRGSLGAASLLRLCSSQRTQQQQQPSLGAQFQQLQRRGSGPNALKLSALVATLQQCRAPEHARFPFLLVDLYQRKGQDFSEEAASHFIQVSGLRCFLGAKRCAVWGIWGLGGALLGDASSLVHCFLVRFALGKCVY